MNITDNIVSLLNKPELMTYAGMKLVSREDAVKNLLRNVNVDAGETGMFLRQ